MKMIGRSKGTTTFLVTLLVATIVLVALCGFAFNYLLAIRSRSLYAADTTALDLATKINIADRVGGVNLLEEASREIVFVSRQNCDRCDDWNMPQLNMVCNQLLENARKGHALIEPERQNQILSICKDAQTTASTYNKERSSKSNFSFFGLSCFEPEILRVELGRVFAVDSSIRDFGAIPDLSDHDRSKGYLNIKSKFYKSDINVKLPDPDSDLDFYFSSLPAYVGTTTAPPRNTNDRVFLSYGSVFANDGTKTIVPKQIPSAVQIHYRMGFAVPWDQSGTSGLGLESTGSTCGASADSK